MRRWLSVFLLVVLPLQFSWVAAAGYCRHEAGMAGVHFGHHSHQHPSAATEPAEPGQTPGGDPDCLDCQAAAMPALTGTSFCPLLEPAAPLAVSAQAAALSPPGSPPERPDWRSAA